MMAAVPSGNASAGQLPSDGEEPPPFNLTAIDRAILASTDEEFHLQTWDDLKRIIANNDLHLLKRKPSDLRRYLAWSRNVKAVHGSISNYIMLQRLKWTPLPSPSTTTLGNSSSSSSSSSPEPVSVGKGPEFDYISPVPFAHEADFKILPNDWPYGMVPGIVHIVVWLKNRIESDPETGGDMTATARKQVEDFVQTRFIDRVQELATVSDEGNHGERDKVQWFRNWTALQSVPGLEHIHVLVRDVPHEMIMEWTGGENAVQ